MSQSSISTLMYANDTLALPFIFMETFTYLPSEFFFSISACFHVTNVVLDQFIRTTWEKTSKLLFRKYNFHNNNNKYRFLKADERDDREVNLLESNLKK